MLYGAIVGLVVGLVIVAVKAMKQKKDNENK
jgi:tetrahydromethanopterin S-methyltransferase subunit G